MLKPKVEEALNNQINAEMYSSYLYLSMSAYLQRLNLVGMAKWMRFQAQEETFHAMKMFDYVLDRGGTPRLAEIKAPKVDWESPLEAFEEAYNHETHVSDMINQLVDLAGKESDHATHNFLQWFVAEQVEEEANADEVVQRLKLIDGAGHGLLMIDQEMGNRQQPAPPSAEA